MMLLLMLRKLHKNTKVLVNKYLNFTSFFNKKEVKFLKSRANFFSMNGNKDLSKKIVYDYKNKNKNKNKFKKIKKGLISFINLIEKTEPIFHNHSLYFKNEKN